MKSIFLSIAVLLLAGTAAASNQVTVPAPGDPRPPVEQLYAAVNDPNVKVINLLPAFDPVTGDSLYVLTEFDPDGYARPNGGRLVALGKTIQSTLVMATDDDGRPLIDIYGEVIVLSPGAVIDGRQMPENPGVSSLTTGDGGSIKGLTVLGADLTGSIAIFSVGTRPSGGEVSGCLVEGGRTGIAAVATEDDADLSAIINGNAVVRTPRSGVVIVPLGFGISNAKIAARLSNNTVHGTGNVGIVAYPSYIGRGSNNSVDLLTLNNLASGNAVAGFRFWAVDGDGVLGKWSSVGDISESNPSGIVVIGGTGATSNSNLSVRLLDTEFRQNVFEDLAALGEYFSTGGNNSVDILVRNATTDGLSTSPFIFFHCLPPVSECSSEVVFTGSSVSFEQATGEQPFGPIDQPIYTGNGPP